MCVCVCVCVGLKLGVAGPYVLNVWAFTCLLLRVHRGFLPIDAGKLECHKLKRAPPPK